MNSKHFFLLLKVILEKVNRTDLPHSTRNNPEYILLEKLQAGELEIFGMERRREMEKEGIRKILTQAERKYLTIVKIQMLVVIRTSG